MSVKTGFYGDAQKGRNGMWVWGIGLGALFGLTFLGPRFVYGRLSDLAQAKMWPSLVQVLSPVGPEDPPHIVIGSELLQWTLSCITLALAIWVAQKWLRRRPLKRIITTAPAFRWKRFGAGCAVYLGIYVLYWLVVIGFALLKPESGILTETSLLQRLEIENLDGKQAFWAALPLVFLFTPVNAALQEIAFRGFLDQGMIRIVPNKFLAFVLAGIVFAAWHYGSSGQYYGWFGFYTGFVIFAVCMSLITHHDQGLEAAIGIHTANNILAFSVIGSPYDGFSTIYWFLDLKIPDYGALSVFTDFCMYGACLIILLFWRAGLSARQRKNA